MLQTDRNVHTTCPYCGVGCQMDLHFRDDVIVRVTGRHDNQVNFGNLCVKGRFGLDFVHAPDRLRHPLLRKSRDREFEQAPWETAMDTLAGRLTAFRDEYGPNSIAILTSAKCTNEENYLMQKLARGLIGTNSVDHCARL
jgi:predicted molibdopterin-dependent oxidoreductase YjgC